jgi:hypothetical protein
MIRQALFLLLLLRVIPVPSEASPHATAPSPKAFAGPNGEEITIIPLDGRKKMLVYAHGVDGINNDKAVIYDTLEDALSLSVGYANFPAKGLGYSMTVVLKREKDRWFFHDFLLPDGKKHREIELTYSAPLTAKIAVKRLLRGARDFAPKP